jgi:hypothetical protein
MRWRLVIWRRVKRFWNTHIDLVRLAPVFKTSRWLAHRFNFLNLRLYNFFLTNRILEINFEHKLSLDYFDTLLFLFSKSWGLLPLNKTISWVNWPALVFQRKWLLFNWLTVYLQILNVMIMLTQSPALSIGLLDHSFTQSTAYLLRNDWLWQWLHLFLGILHSLQFLSEAKRTLELVGTPPLS